MKGRLSITLVLSCILSLSVVAQDEIIKMIAPIEGHDVEVLVMTLPADSVEIVQKWTEFSLKRGELVSFSSLTSNHERGTMKQSDLDVTDEPLRQFETIFVSIPDSKTGMSIAHKTADGDLKPKLSKSIEVELRSLMNDFASYVRTGFMVEDELPNTNMPAEQIEELNPVHKSSIKPEDY